MSVRWYEWCALLMVVCGILFSFQAGAGVDDTCYLVDPTTYEDEVVQATVDALTQLEWALVILTREPGEPPYRGDPEVALKQATRLAKEAWLLLKEER